MGCQREHKPQNIYFCYSLRNKTTNENTCEPMKKLFKPACLLFYFLTVIVFFFIGLYVASLVGAGKNQMLAGGAIVLFYGLVSAGLSFVLALIVAYRVTLRSVITINKILGVLFLVFIGLTAYKIMDQEKNKKPAQTYPNRTTAPVDSSIL